MKTEQDAFSERLRAGLRQTRRARQKAVVRPAMQVRSPCRLQRRRARRGVEDFGHRTGRNEQELHQGAVTACPKSRVKNP